MFLSTYYEAFVSITNFEHFWLKPLTLYDLGRALKFLAGDIFVLLLLVCVVGVALLVDAKNNADEGARRLSTHECRTAVDGSVMQCHWIAGIPDGCGQLCRVIPFPFYL